MALARPIGAASAMATPVMINVPARTVAIENLPRRGNQPSANNWERSIFDRKATASKRSDRTIPALIRIETMAAANRKARIARSLRRRLGLPRRRLPGAGMLAELNRSPPTCSCSFDGALQVYGRMGRRNRPDLRAGPAGSRRKVLLAGRPGRAARVELAGRQIHVRNCLEHGRDRAIGEGVVDVARDGRVGGRLGLVDVDVQAPREGIGSIGDRGPGA